MVSFNLVNNALFLLKSSLPFVNKIQNWRKQVTSYIIKTCDLMGEDITVHRQRRERHTSFLKIFDEVKTMLEWINYEKPDVEMLSFFMRNASWKWRLCVIKAQQGKAESNKTKMCSATFEVNETSLQDLIQIHVKI